MLIWGKCKNPTCRKQFTYLSCTPRKFCCRRCFAIWYKGKPKPKGFGSKVSKASRGKPKPWQRGSKNINYGNKTQGRPDIHEKFLLAVKKRGQPWSRKEKLAHSKRMLGDCNKMRGKHHSEKTKNILSKIMKKRYADGIMHIKRYKRSKAEKAIGAFIRSTGIQVETQFHIPGVSYRYDFYIPECNLIIEYQGNYWHGNPEKYYIGSTVAMQNIGRIAVEDIWQRDFNKYKEAASRGYKIVYIWETAYKKHGNKLIKETINKCL